MALIYSFAVWNLTAALLCYFILYRKKILIEDRFATTVTQTAASTSALVVGIHSSILLPSDLASIFFVNILIGVSIGILFGSLVKFHSILIGFYQGMMGSLMGVMIGEVLKNPQICSIPIVSAQAIYTNMYLICGFSTLFLSFVLALVLYTLRV